MRKRGTVKVLQDADSDVGGSVGVWYAGGNTGGGQVVQ